MSAPVLLGYAEGGNYTEHKKDQTQNKVTQTPGEACAKERQDGEQSKVACLSVHSRSRLERGSDGAAPPAGRELMALNLFTARSLAAGRQAIFLKATEPRAARPGFPTAHGDASRPRRVGGVNGW